MKKVLCVVCALCMLLLAGCAPKLPEGFTQADVESAAKATVALVNDGDYDALYASLRKDVQDAITKADIETAFRGVLDGAGTFKEIRKIAVGSTKGQSGESYAVAAIACSYESVKVTYTFSYDVNYALVGLYIK